MLLFYRRASFTTEFPEFPRAIAITGSDIDGFHNSDEFCDFFKKVCEPCMKCKGGIPDGTCHSLCYGNFLDVTLQERNI